MIDEYLEYINYIKKEENEEKRNNEDERVEDREEIGVSNIGIRGRFTKDIEEREEKKIKKEIIINNNYYLINYTETNFIKLYENYYGYDNNNLIINYIKEKKKKEKENILKSAKIILSKNDLINSNLLLINSISFSDLFSYKNNNLQYHNLKNYFYYNNIIHSSSSSSATYNIGPISPSTPVKNSHSTPSPPSPASLTSSPSPPYIQSNLYNSPNKLNSSATLDFNDSLLINGSSIIEGGDQIYALIISVGDNTRYGKILSLRNEKIEEQIKKMLPWNYYKNLLTKIFYNQCNNSNEKNNTSKKFLSEKINHYFNKVSIFYKKFNIIIILN